MSEEAKCSCQRCGQNIEFPVVMSGQDATCPHCGRETTLTVPKPSVRKAAPDYPPVVPTTEKPVELSTIFCSYVLCFLIPIAGLGAGIYLLMKKQEKHGYICVAISILWMMFLFAAITGIFG